MPNLRQGAAYTSPRQDVVYVPAQDRGLLLLLLCHPSSPIFTPYPGRRRTGSSQKDRCRRLRPSPCQRFQLRQDGESTSSATGPHDRSRATPHTPCARAKDEQQTTIKMQVSGYFSVVDGGVLSGTRKAGTRRWRIRSLTCVIAVIACVFSSVTGWKVDSPRARSTFRRINAGLSPVRRRVSLCTQRVTVRLPCLWRRTRT